MNSSKLGEKQIESILDSDVGSGSNDDSESESSVFVDKRKKAQSKSSRKSASRSKQTEVKHEPQERRSQRKRKVNEKYCDSITVQSPNVCQRRSSNSSVEESGTHNLNDTKTTCDSQSVAESESNNSKVSKYVNNLKKNSAAKKLFCSGDKIKVPRIQLRRYQTPCGEQWKPKQGSLDSPVKCQVDGNLDKTQSCSSTPEKVRTPRKNKNICDSIPELLQSCNESSPLKNTQKRSTPEKVRTRSASKLSPIVCSSISPRTRRFRTPQKKAEDSPSKVVGEASKSTPASSTRKTHSTLSPVLEEAVENKSNKCKTPSKRVLDFLDGDENNDKENKIIDNEKSTPSSRRTRITSEDQQRTPTSKLKGNHINNVHSPLSRLSITVKTPISKKGSGRQYLSPSMAKKEHEASRRTDDALDFTRKQLHISTVPKSLPCRDSEFTQIKSFLTRKIEHHAGGCMYISGVPGTGKTATVLAVIRSLQELVDEEELPDFDFVEVNGLRLTEPKQAYVRIYQALTDQKVTPDQAQQMLNKRFSANCRKSTIILVDELDYLCNRRQDVVYNILDWPTNRNSRLVVLTISNTMDLPERTLKGRVTSRMGLTRVTYQPYTHHQLMAIVQDRLSGSDTFHPDAVQLVARKVAAVSGDARRALDICRRTTELVVTGEQVTVSHVEQALTQIFSGPRVVVIQSLNGLSQLTLRAMRDVCQRSGVDETTAHQVYKHLHEICTLDGCLLPTVGAVLQTIVSLVALGLVVAEKGRMDITRKMSLNVSSDDIHYALNKCSS